MPIDEIRLLLEKYQQGLCTAEERKIIANWYDSLRLGNEGLKEDALAGSLEKIRGNLKALTGDATAPEASIPAAPDRETAAPVTPVIYPYRWRRDARIAACAALITLVVGWTLLLLHQPPSVTPALAFQDKDDTTVITNRGETKQIVLQDGSTIELNAGTQFRYPKKFAGSTRGVTLIKGEAFFQVTTDPARPFIVTTGKWRTTVLGTSFDIRAYGQDQATRIALLTGKVKVSEAQGARSTLLLPRQLIRIDPVTGQMQTDKFVDDYEVAAWKEGAMHFKDASFADIAFGIGNKYNVTLINKSNKRRWSYTGLFRNESLQEVVETICQTEGLGYRFSAEGIVINNRN